MELISTLHTWVKRYWKHVLCSGELHIARYLAVGVQLSSLPLLKKKTDFLKGISKRALISSNTVFTHRGYRPSLSDV